MIICSLTPGQIATTNGCGSSYFLARPFRIPKWLGFHCLCQIHDYAYSTGSTLEEKYEADDELYNAMMYDSFHTKNKIMKAIKIQVTDATYWCLSTKLSDACFIKAQVCGAVRPIVQ